MLATVNTSKRGCNMDIELWKKTKKEKRLTNQDISELSGVPKRTIENIFSGSTSFPRADTVQAIEKALGINNEPVELSPIKKKLIDIISQLSDENVEKAIAILTVINK
jgi:transcriptional regulator with XRE-family HTH domain